MRGVDTYKRAMFHECAHKRILQMIAAYWPDEDGDTPPDYLENQVGLDPDVADTTETGDLGSGEDRVDNEVFARMCEADIFATQSEVDGDWADDGLNFGDIEPPNRCQRIVRHYRAGYSDSNVDRCEAWWALNAVSP